MIHGPQASDSYYSSPSGGGDVGMYYSPAPAPAPTPVSLPAPFISTPSQNIGYSGGAAYTPVIIPTPSYTSPAPIVVPQILSNQPIGYQGGTYNPATGETTGGSPSEAQMAADRLAAGIGPGGVNLPQIEAMKIPVDSLTPYINIGVPTVPIKPETLIRSDYYAPSLLGDSLTLRLVAEGSTLEQALLAQAKASPTSKERLYYETELSKALGSNIALASEYHYQAMASGLPVAPNPFEYASDLSLTALNRGSFTTGQFKSSDIDRVSLAKLTGDVGPYNANNLFSYSSAYGKLSILEQQDIAKMVASTRPDLVIDESRLEKLPSPKYFGYGGGTLVPFSVAEAGAKKLEAAEQAALTGNLVGGKTVAGEITIIGKPVENTMFTLAGAPAKYSVEEGVFKGSAETVAIEKLLTSQSSAIEAAMAGKLNAKNQFTGTAGEFAALTAMAKEYETTRQKYNKIYGEEYAASAAERKYALTIIPRGDIFGAPKPKKTIWEEIGATADRVYDVAGGFVRGVGSLTKTAYTPNVIDLMTEIPGMRYISLPVMLAARPGAQEKAGTTPFSLGETMPYGAYSELSSQVSREYIQPIVGSPAKYEGYTKMWEAEYNKPGATPEQKLIAGLNIIGTSGSKYFIEDPGAVPIIVAQAAALEATGAFSLLGKGGEFVLGKGASLFKVAENPLVQKGISMVGKYGVDAAFGTVIVGSATQNEEGQWFKTTKPTDIYKNVGPLGVQLVAFTAGTYGTQYVKGRSTGTPMEKEMADKGFVEAEFKPSKEPFTPAGGGGRPPSGGEPGPGSSRGTSGGTTTGTTKITSPAEIFKGMIESKAGGDTFARYEAAYKMRTYTETYARTGDVKFKSYADIYPSLKPAGDIINPYTGKVEYRAGPSGKIEYGDFGMAKSYASPAAQKVDMIPRAAFEGIQTGAGGIKLRVEEIYVPDKTTGKYSVEKFTPEKPYSATPKEVAVYKKPVEDMFKEITANRPKKEIDIWRETTKKVEAYRKPKEELLTVRKSKEEIDFWRKPKEEILAFRKPKEEMDLFKVPKKEMDLFKFTKGDIVSFRTPPEKIVSLKRGEVVPFREPFEKIITTKRGEVTVFKELPEKVVTTKRGEIVPVKDKYVELFREPPTKITPFKYEEILPREKPAKETKPFEELPPAKGGGIGLPVIPWGGLGGGGGGTGGMATGRGRSFSEYFRYGFGIYTDLFGMEKGAKARAKKRRL